MKLREGHQLVTAGPYRRVRHPLYTAFILLGIAWFLLTGNWLIGGTWLTAIVLGINTRLNPEERMLLDEVGEVYARYQRQTGRFLPRL